MARTPPARTPPIADGPVRALSAQAGVLGRGTAARAAGAGLRRWGAGATAAATAAAVAALPLLPMAARPVPGARYGFDRPDSLAASGHTLLVANGGGDSVTLLDTASGKLLAVLAGARYSFRHPSAIAVVGDDAFVANAGGSITELSVATRSVVRVIDGRGTRISDPVSLAAAGGDLFVLGAGGTLSKLDAATGKVLGTLTGLGRTSAVATAGGRLFVSEPSAGAVAEVDAASLTRLAGAGGSWHGRPAFAAPADVATLDGTVWVTDQSGRSLTELSAATGRVVGVVPDMSGYLPSPVAITSGDGDLFVASPPGSSPMITQVVPGTRVAMPWMMCNTNAAYTFSNPDALTVVGPQLWVANAGGAGGPAGNSVTEMNARTGALVRVLR